MVADIVQRFSGEDCLEESDGCDGSSHQPVKVETIFNELKQDITKVRDKVEKRKSELSALENESDKVLTQYGEETKKMVELLRKTKEEQIQVINDKYVELERQLIEGREVAGGELFKFKTGVVAAEHSQLNSSLQKTMTGFTRDHVVDVVTRGKAPSQKLEVMVEKDLPYLYLDQAVELVIKCGGEELKAETTTSKINLEIGKEFKKSSVHTENIYPGVTNETRYDQTKNATRARRAGKASGASTAADME